MPKRRTPARLALAIVSWIVFAAIALPIVTGRPVFSYASSGSMEPTIMTFDAFFVEPWPSDVKVGDVIVFLSASRGGPSVHRIVGGDARNGWYTQGDANPETDQNGGEPVVTGDRVLGRVVTFDGRPLLIPGLGVSFIEMSIAWTKFEQSAGGPRNLAVGAFVSMALLAGLAFLVGGKTLPERREPRPRLERTLRHFFPRGILGKHMTIALLAVLLVTTTFGATAARREVPTHVVVVADPSSGDGIRAGYAGQVLERKISLGSLGFLPTTAIIEAGSSGITPPGGTTHVPTWSRVEIPYRLTAGGTVGLQEELVVVYRYPAALPAEWTRTLHDAAPGSPYYAIAGILTLVGAFWIRALGVWNAPVGRDFGLEAS